LAKIAVELERALARRAVTGEPGSAKARVLAEGDGWCVEDVLCTSGPQDRAFEEQHSAVAVAMVLAGSFEYRSEKRRELMVPGSLLLGNPSQSFECGHEHGSGDRCLSFKYDPEFFEQLAFDRVRLRRSEFSVLRVPPVRATASMVAAGAKALLNGDPASWEEFSLIVAAHTLVVSEGETTSQREAPPSALARVTRTVRMIEHDPSRTLSIQELAREARLSPYHFLRTFQQLTGLTPHQFVMRIRLREAALRLAAGPARIVDIAFASGFNDVSNFNRAFRSEFGVSPRIYRHDAETPSRERTAALLCH
jgi:AraC-like DNA-binding protein